ncbi:MAG: Gfo/Idh/MocA family oxidoreductase [Cyclobacteriaceae bacterium]
MKGKQSSKSSGAGKNRRDFLRGSALAAAGFFIVPRNVLGGPGYQAPSDKLNLASIGAGGKGWSDIRNSWNNGSENVLALCDVDKISCAKAIDLWPKASFFNDYRKLLDDVKDLDAVVISAPDHIHAVAALSAMDLGLHVYVQKPLTHNIKEARFLTERATTKKIVTQMGNQGASNPAQKQMVEWFDNGTIGAVNEVYVWTDRPVWPQGIPFPTNKPARPNHISADDWNMFIGPAQIVDYHPLFHPFKWRGWWNFGTGALGDMGCHLIDTPFRVLGLGYPTEVECSIGQVFTKDWVPEYIPQGCPPSGHVQIKFPATQKNNSEMVMTWYDGGIRPFHPELIPANDPIGDTDSRNGVMMIGEKGIMTCGTYGENPQVYLPGGDKIVMPEGYKGENNNLEFPEWGHQKAWTDAVKAGYDSKEHKALTSSFDYSGPLTETVLMGNLAIRSYQHGVAKNDGKLDFPGRKRLLWDGDKMEITNYKAANEFVTREYRKGWELS